jgi:hypothetical protein
VSGRGALRTSVVRPPNSRKWSNALYLAPSVANRCRAEPNPAWKRTALTWRCGPSVGTVTSLFCNGVFAPLCGWPAQPVRPDRQAAEHLKHRYDSGHFAKLYQYRKQWTSFPCNGNASTRCHCGAERKQRGAILTNPPRIKLQSDLREAFQLCAIITDPE